MERGGKERVGREERKRERCEGRWWEGRRGDERVLLVGRKTAENLDFDEILNFGDSCTQPVGRSARNFWRATLYKYSILFVVKFRFDRFIVSTLLGKMPPQYRVIWPNCKKVGVLVPTPFHRSGPSFACKSTPLNWCCVMSCILLIQISLWSLHTVASVGANYCHITALFDQILKFGAPVPSYGRRQGQSLACDSILMVWSTLTCQISSGSVYFLALKGKSSNFTAFSTSTFCGGAISGI